MADTLVVLGVVLFGVVVPAVVFGLILFGIARYGHTAVVTASWTISLGMIALYEYGVRGVNSLVVSAVVLLLACMLWTWPYRMYLIPHMGFAFRKGGHVDDPAMHRSSVAAALQPMSAEPDMANGSTPTDRKEKT